MPIIEIFFEYCIFEHVGEHQFKTYFFENKALMVK